MRTNTRDLIKLPAVMEPHQGTSYNPPAVAHHELLLKAASVEQKRVAEAEKLAEVKAKMEACRVVDNLGENVLPLGMTLQEIGDPDENEDVPADSISQTMAVATRKTKAQRNREARRSAEASIFEASFNWRPDCTTFRNERLLNEFLRKNYWVQ